MIVQDSGGSREARQHDIDFSTVEPVTTGESAAQRTGWRLASLLRRQLQGGDIREHIPAIVVYARTHSLDSDDVMVSALASWFDLNEGAALSLTRAMDRVEADPWRHETGTGNIRLDKLATLAFYVAENNGGKFFMSCRVAAQFVDRGHSQGAEYLRALRGLGIIQIAVEANFGQHRAAEYQWIATEIPDLEATETEPEKPKPDTVTNTYPDLKPTRTRETQPTEAERSGERRAASGGNLSEEGTTASDESIDAYPDDRVQGGHDLRKWIADAETQGLDGAFIRDGIRRINWLEANNDGFTGKDRKYHLNQLALRALALRNEHAAKKRTRIDDDTIQRAMTPVAGYRAPPQGDGLAETVARCDWVQSNDSRHRMYAKYARLIYPHAEAWRAVLAEVEDIVDQVDGARSNGVALKEIINPAKVLTDRIKDVAARWEINLNVRRAVTV